MAEINGNTVTEIKMVEPEPEPHKSCIFGELVKELATNPSVDAAKLEAIINMQKDNKEREAQVAFNAAMSRVQQLMPVVPTDKNNTQTHSKYASYEQLLKYTKHIYTADGFSLSFYEEKADIEGEIRISVDIMHEAGYSKKRYADIPFDNKGLQGKLNKTRPHAKGSSFSYGRSYLMKMIWNISTGDGDDGNDAGKKATEKQLKDISEKQKKNNISNKDFTNRLYRKYGITEPEMLFEYQAEDLIKTLCSMIKKNKERT